MSISKTKVVEKAAFRKKDQQEPFDGKGIVNSRSEVVLIMLELGRTG